MIPISREEAHRQCEDNVVLVRARNRGIEVVTVFDRQSPYYHSTGPYDYSSPRYFLASPSRNRFGANAGGSARKIQITNTDVSAVSNQDQDWLDEPESEPEENLLRQNLPSRATAKIDFMSELDGSLVETKKVTLDVLPHKMTWISRKTGLEWNKPVVRINAEAGAAKASGDNSFKFKKFPDYPMETKSITCSSGIFGWTGRFDIEFKAGILHVTTKIKLINRLGAKPAPGDPTPGAGTPVTDEDKADMKKDIESKLTGKWFMHRKNCDRNKVCDCSEMNGCCKFRVRIHVEFVESGEHHIVNLFQGPGRANATNWTRVKTRANSWAHETGHLLAWYDEYSGGAVGVAPRWKSPNDTAVMSSGLAVPFEYYWDFRDWLKQKSSQEWEGVD
ncbi:MAG TPA: hypothetical protein VK465_09480 [Fibrobacteria bacterium]|nr:hypothetical protein [Fibrobacteria bacterium]